MGVDARFLFTLMQPVVRAVFCVAPWCGASG